jgi:tRNA A37 N6-isopentenylltransferase MiaA
MLKRWTFFVAALLVMAGEGGSATRQDDHSQVTLMASLRPVIAVCGTTGVGKSKLAVELALRLAEGAAVINADSMQVYRGLDILTNKLPREEMKGVPHLLMDFKQPGEQYVIGQWVDEAAKAVSLMFSLV